MIRDHRGLTWIANVHEAFHDLDADQCRLCLTPVGVWRETGSPIKFTGYYLTPWTADKICKQCAAPIQMRHQHLRNLMTSDEQVTLYAAISRLISEYTAIKLVSRVEPNLPEDQIRMDQTISCIAALMEHSDEATLRRMIYQLNIETFLPHHLDDYIRESISACLVSGALVE